MITNENYQARAKELIAEAFPVYEGSVNVTNDNELEALLIKLQTGYEELVDEFLKKYRKDITDYIEQTSPHGVKTKRDAQNDYVIGYFRNQLLKYKKPTKETLYTGLWAFKQQTRDSSRDYD